MNRADAEGVLIRRVGKLFTAVDLDGTTVDGSNGDLNDPLRVGLKRLGYTVTSVSGVTDADIEALTLEDQEPFIDFAELRCLETALNAASALVDVSIGPRRESLSQLAARLEKNIEQKRAAIQAEYGDLYGQGLEAGVIGLSFQEDETNIY